MSTECQFSVRKEFTIETSTASQKISNIVMRTLLFPNKKNERYKNNYLFKMLSRKYNLNRIFITVPQVKRNNKLKFVNIICEGDDYYNLNFCLIEVCNVLMYKCGFENIELIY